MEFIIRGIKHKDEILALKEFFVSLGIADVLEKNPDIYEKPLYPYMIHPQYFKRRLRMVQEHYQKFAQTFNKQTIKKLNDDLMPLARVECSGSVYTLNMGLITHFANEGELTIGLYGEKGERYYIASWNFVADEADGIMIGALQGTSDLGENDAKDVIKNVTKDFEGLRPQILLITVVGMIAKLTGCSKLYGVRTNAHVYNAGRKIKRIKTDYDFFWGEAGGEEISTSLFSLPLTYERKPIEEVKSNKRAMYRRRYDLLDEIENQVEANFSNLLKV